MKLNIYRHAVPSLHPIPIKMLLSMKLVTIFIFAFTFQLKARSYAQVVTLSHHNATLEAVLKDIHEQTGYYFLYDNQALKKLNGITIEAVKVSLQDALDQCISHYPLGYLLENKTILIFAKKQMTTVLRPAKMIQGVVTDSKGTALSGVTIRIKNSNIGTVTDGKGHFQIKIPDSTTVLQISYLGFQTQETTVGSRTTLQITLQPSTNNLNQLVVVGYGTQKKSSLTSAVSRIDGENLVQRPVANGPQALQGLAPGVTVVDGGGGPGESNATIRIRGITTLGSNDPLVIVDGIEQNLQDINPNDIESVTILKDAASTAIYGSRAANGVVLVTTKRAKSGKLTVKYDGYYAIQRSIYHPEHMGLEDFLRLGNVGAANVGIDPPYTEQQIQDWVHATDRYKYPLPNVWFDYYLNPAPQQNHTLSVGGGTDRLKTLLTVNYFHQKGIIPNSYGNKKDIRLNTDFKVSKRITLSGDFNYRLKEYTRPLNEELSFRYMLSGSNFAVPKYPDGTYGLGSENYSPLVTNELDGISHYRTNYGVINLRGKINLLKGLDFETRYGAKLISYYQKDFAKAYEIHDYYNPDNILKAVGPNSLTETRNNNREFTLNNLLTYTSEWGGHSLNGLLGYSQISYIADELSASRNNFYNNNVGSISQGSADSKDNDGKDFSWGLRSYFGRLTYNYNEKYYFEANARYDGSSRFTGNKRYSFFPSFSGAWRISQENFWSGLAPVVNELKLRGSWGQSGNQAVDLYSYFQTLSAMNYNFGGDAVQGIIQSTLANRDLTWETTTQTDLGLDIQFAEGKLGVSFDYYIKKTDGILLNLPVPATVGLDAPPQNAGVVENKGWELALNYRDNIDDFHYSITANLADVHNKVVSLEGTGPYIDGNPNEILTIRKEGLPIDAYIGYKTLGFFQTKEEIENYPVFDPATQEGDIKYADINNDGAINADDYIVLGSSIPRYTFGVNIGMGYRNFDLSIFLQGVGKANGLPSGAFREQGNWGGFTLALEKDYWTPENTDATFPRPESQTTRNSQMSDFWMINTAYLKVKNLQIGYTLPKTLTSRFDITMLRVYVSGSNLFTFSQATKWGLDPEFPSGRLNYYPQVSLYTFGINLNF